MITQPSAASLNAVRFKQHAFSSAIKSRLFETSATLRRKEFGLLCNQVVAGSNLPATSEMQFSFISANMIVPGVLVLVQLRLITKPKALKRGVLAPLTNHVIRSTLQLSVVLVTRLFVF